MKNEEGFKPILSLVINTIFHCLNYIMPAFYSVAWLKFGCAEQLAAFVKQQYPDNLLLQIWKFNVRFLGLYLILAFIVVAISYILYCVTGLRESGFPLLILGAAQIFSSIPILQKMVDVTPLCDDDEVLFERLVDWGRTHGDDVGSIQVLHSKHYSKAANAFYAGFGRLSKITLLDTLFDYFNHSEIEAIVAHEVGHKHDYLKPWGSFVVQFVIAELVVIWGVWQVISSGSVKVIPLVFLLIIISWFFTTIFTNMVSRYSELFADTYAVLRISNGEDFKSFIRKSAVENNLVLNPPGIIAYLFHSYPSPGKRLENAESVINAKINRPS